MATLLAECSEEREGGIEMDCLSASQQKKKDPVISFYKQDKVTSLEDSRKMTSETISLLFFIL